MQRSAIEVASPLGVLQPKDTGDAELAGAGQPSAPATSMEVGVPGEPAPNQEFARSMVPNLRRMAPQIVAAGVFPVVGYALLRPHVASDAVALAAVLVFPVIEILTERLRRGRFEPIGIIALIGIGAGLIGALALHGDATLLKVRESLVTWAFGVVCLVSLGTPRPAMFYLGRAFATGGDPAKVAEFNEIWDLPTVPRRFQLVTAVWGLGLVGEAVLRTFLALTISTESFLIVSLLLFWGMIGALLWFSVASSRSGERRVTAMLEEDADASAHD